ncbi:hypothetical protein EDB82DRAFT_560829 [Fusarium venenatum]|uniref:uncharacterized protein n=1 Tax=Fusarium venenatum TaxID=56646 RepID=UPI001DF7665E|nr:hypothetical protein EDB82DRAFT_560829 [Fusarium venenatum]
MDKFEASRDGVKLSEILKPQKKINTGNSEVELAKLIKTLQGKMERAGIGGRIADAIGKVVPHINRFAIVGDVAVSANPNPAALPWAAIRFVLLNITAGEDIRAKILEGIAEILILIFECCIYHELHLTMEVAKRLFAVKRLHDAIVNALSQCIRFLAFAIRRQEAGAKALTDAFRFEDFSGYLKDLQKVKFQLHDAVLSCEMYQNSQSRELLRELHKLIINMREGSIQRLEQEAKSKLKTLLLDPKDAFDHIQHREDSFCLPGTRQNVLREIYDWTEDSGSPTVCWLSGLAGTGKSTISRTVARDLKVRQHIIDAAQEDLSPLTGSMHEQWRILIQEPLDKVQDKEFLRHVVLVIDALDECDQGDQGTIITLLTKCSDVLKVFVTSRPEFKIGAYFARQQQFHREIALHHVKSRDIETDIAIYLKHYIRKFLLDYNACYSREVLRLDEDWPGSKRFQILVKRCAPLFIAAATFIRMLQDISWSEGPESKLKIVIETSSQVSSAYESIYKPILNRISNSAPHEVRAKAQYSFTHIIGSVILLARPLSITSLAVLLGVKIQDVVGLVNPLRSVLEIPRDDGPIKLFHLSFRDFLLSKSAEDLKVDKALTHAKLASRCLRHLERELRTDICCLESPGKSRSDMDPDVINHHVTPEIQYACLYWVHHVVLSRKQVQDGNEEHQFLKRFFLNWIEVLCLIERVVESLDMLQALLDTIKGESGSQVIRFIQDAIQFVRFFRAGIDDTPLQLYHSGILFPLSSSIVPQPLEDRLCPKSVTRLPTTHSNWPQSLQAFEVGHNSFKLQLAFLSNNRIISWGLYDDIKIWDTSCGSCLKTLEDRLDLERHDPLLVHDYTSVAIGTFCEGQLLAVGVCERIKIWNFDSLSLTECLILESCLILNFAFSDDGSLLFSISKVLGELHSDSVLHIHDIGTASCVSRFQIRKDYSAICLSMRGQWLASIANECIWLSDWNSSEGLDWVNLGPENYTDPHIQFSSDGSLLAVTSKDGYIRTWQTGTKQCVWALQYPYTEVIGSLCLTQDWLAVSSNRYQTVIFDLKRGIVSHEMDKIANGSLAISADSTLLATISTGDIVRVWDLFPKPSSGIGNLHPNTMQFLTITSDNSTAVSACENQVKAWDISSGLCIETFDESNPTDSSMMFCTAAEDGSLFATTRGVDVEIWSLRPLRQIQVLRRKSKLFVNTNLPWAISTNGEILALSSYFDDSEYCIVVERIEIWDVHSGFLLHTLDFSPSSFPKIALSSDGSRIAYTTDDIIEVRRISEPYNLFTRIENDEFFPFTSLAFHGQQLVGILFDGEIKAWDTETGKLFRSYQTDRPKLDKSFIDHEALLGHLGHDVHLVHDVLKELQVSVDANWITRSGERVLWLPPDYRPSITCASGSIIAIGTKSGRVFNLCMAE